MKACQAAELSANINFSTDDLLCVTNASLLMPEYVTDVVSQCAT